MFGKKIIGYKVIMTPGIELLQSEVQAWINEGWIPWGSMTTKKSGTDTIYIQPMILKR